MTTQDSKPSAHTCHMKTCVACNDAKAEAPMPSAQDDVLNAVSVHTNCAKCGYQTIANGTYYTQKYVDKLRATIDRQAAEQPNFPAPKYSWSADGKTATFENWDECRAAALAAGATPASSSLIPMTDEQVDNLSAILDAYESGIGHGLKRDGHKEGPYSLRTCRIAYRSGYDEGLERAALAKVAQPAVGGVICGWLQYIDGEKTQNFARNDEELQDIKKIFKLAGGGRPVEYVPVYFYGPACPSELKP